MFRPVMMAPVNGNVMARRRGELVRAVSGRKSVAIDATGTSVSDGIAGGSLRGSPLTLANRAWQLLVSATVIGCFVVESTCIGMGPATPQGLSVMLLVLAAEAYRSPVAFTIVAHERYLGLFVLLCIASPAWTVVTLHSAVTVGLLAVTFLGASCLSSWYRCDAQVRLFLAIGSITTGLSAWGIITGQPWAFSTEYPFVGMMQGIYLSKIGLGESLSLTCVVAVLAGMHASTRRQRCVIGMIGVVAALLLVGCRSITSLAATVGALSAILLRRLYRRDGSMRLLLARAGGGLVLLGLVVMVAAWFRTFLPNYPSASSTLVDRVLIWRISLGLGSASPLIGTGYTGLWSGWSQQHVQFGQFTVPHSHNVFLEVWLQTGVVGLLCFLICGVAAARRAWRHADPWPLAGLVLCAMHGITDVSPPERSLLPLLFATCVLTSARADCRGGVHADMGGPAVS